MTVFFGTNRLKNMTPAALTLFKSLIDEKCFSQLTWKRPGKGGIAKIKIQTMQNIQKILLQVLQLMDKRYCSDDLKDDIVYRVLPRI